MRMRRLPPRERFALQHIARRIGRERIGYLDNHLAFAMGTKALLARVLIFDFECMPVGTFDLNSHVRPASRTAEDLEKIYSKSDEHSENEERSPCPNSALCSVCL